MNKLLLTIALLLLFSPRLEAGDAGQGTVSPEEAYPLEPAPSSPPPASGQADGRLTPPPETFCGPACSSGRLDGPFAGSFEPQASSAVFVGGDFLFIRPHFSEAVAFARGRQGSTSFAASAQELDFDYEPSFRTYLGYQFGECGESLVVTYWNFDGDVEVSGRANANDFLVDPFGNVAGVAINPATLNVFPSGDTIRTRAEVEMDVMDLDVQLPLIQRGKARLLGIAGVRVAWVDQFYESVVTQGNTPFARGDFTVDFTGAGPHLGGHLRYGLDQNGNINAYMKSTGALLIGEYDVGFSNTTTVPPFSATQSESVTRTIPVFEAEVGLDVAVLSNLNVSAGWMFQSWLDLGTSGGDFAGLFQGADDSNTMSFDGLLLRAELSY